MFAPEFFCVIFGLLFFAVVVGLRIRQKINLDDMFRWCVVASVIVIYGLFPAANDNLGQLLGISYPPIMPILFGTALMLLKILLNDTTKARTQVNVERLIQRVSILEAELDQEKRFRRDKQTSSSQTHIQPQTSQSQTATSFVENRQA